VLDTVGASFGLAGVDVWDLERRGFEVCTRSRNGESLLWAWLVAADGLRVRYFPVGGRAAVEVSLPRLVRGRNDVVLSYGECRSAFRDLAERVGEYLGASLPNPDDWLVYRFDPVAAWPCSPAAYLACLHVARLPGTSLVSEPGSLRWRSLRSGRIKARFYDKSAEVGCPVALPTRFERQLRPAREIVRVDGLRVGRRVADLTEGVLVSVIREGLSQLGLDKPVRGLAAARGVLVEAYGRTRGSRLWSELLAFRECGGWPSDYSPAKRRRLERALVRAGLPIVSLDGCELPGLNANEP